MKLKLLLPLVISVFFSQTWAALPTVPIVLINQCTEGEVDCNNSAACLHPILSGNCIKSVTTSVYRGAGPTTIANVTYACNYKISGNSIYPSGKIYLLGKNNLLNVTVVFVDVEGGTCKPFVAYMLG